MENLAFSRYGITLSRLQMSELELLRSWRNDPAIASLMQQQSGKIITSDEQIRWFNSIKDSPNAFYFMAYWKGQPVGYSAIKNIDWNARYGEPGNITKTDNPVVSLFKTMATFDLFFEKLEMKYLLANFKSNNYPIIKFSSLFGYKALSQQNDEFIQYRLDKQIYLTHRANLLQKFSLI